MQVQFLLILVNYTSNIKLTLRNSKQVAVGEAMVLELSVLLMSQDACMCESGPFLVFYFSQYKMYIQENNNLCQKKKKIVLFIVRCGLLSTTTTITAISVSYTYHKTVLLDLCLFLNSSNRSNPFKVDPPIFYCILSYCCYSTLFFFLECLICVCNHNLSSTY